MLQVKRLLALLALLVASTGCGEMWGMNSIWSTVNKTIGFFGIGYSNPIDSMSIDGGQNPIDVEKNLIKKLKRAIDKAEKRFTKDEIRAALFEADKFTDPKLILEISRPRRGDHHRKIRAILVESCTDMKEKYNVTSTVFPGIFLTKLNNENLLFQSRYPIARCWKTQDNEHIVAYTKGFLNGDFKAVKKLCNLDKKSSVLNDILNDWSPPKN